MLSAYLFVDHTSGRFLRALLTKFLYSFLCSLIGTCQTHLDFEDFSSSTNGYIQDEGLKICNFSLSSSTLR